MDEKGRVEWNMDRTHKGRFVKQVRHNNPTERRSVERPRRRWSKGILLWKIDKSNA